jgi:hypothetical protein
VRRGAVALAVLLAVVPARAQYTKWTQDQHAESHSLIHLPAPGSEGTAAIRLQDVAVGAGLLKATGLNGSITNAVAGTDYLLPGSASPGNYDRVSVASSGLVTGGASMVVANVAALEALAGANYRDGNVVFVQSLKVEWIYAASSSLTVDHITVATVSGVGGARWLRKIDRNLIWEQQSAWWVDPSGGNDEAAGTSSGAPLKTFAELGRRLTSARLRTAVGNPVITLLGSAPSSDPLILTDVYSDGFVTVNVVGTPTVISGGRTLTSPRNPGLTDNDHFEITDASATFTAWISTPYLLHRTNGTQAWFWPYKDLGSHKLHISYPMDAAGVSVLSLSNGDTYEVLDLPTFADVVFEPKPNFSVGAKISLVKEIGATNAGFPLAAGSTQLDRVVSVAPFGAAYGGVSTIDSVRLSNICVPASDDVIQLLGSFGLWGGLFAGDGTTSSVVYNQGYSEGGLAANTITLGGRRFDVAHDARAEKFSFMVYDWSGALPGIVVSHGSYSLITGIGGERNTGQLVGVDTFSSVANQDHFTTWNSAITTNATPYSVSGTNYGTAALGIETNQMATRFVGIVDFFRSTWLGDLGGVGVAPSVLAITASNGPTQWPIGSISNGQLLLASGGSIVGTASTGFVPSTRTVTGTAPILIDGDNAAHDLSANRTWSFAFDNTTLTLTGGNALQRAALSGDLACAAGSNTCTFATVNSNVGSFTNASVTVNAKGLVTAASSGATPALASRNLTAGAGMTGGGDLSADRTFDVVANADGTIVVNANDVQAGVMQTPNIADDAVTNAKLANIATGRFKGRVTAGTGDPEDITGTQATTLLDAFTSSLKGLAPASGGGTTNFLRADGTWAAPPASGADALGYYFVSRSTNAPTNAVNFGAFASGVLQHTVSGSVSSPSVFSATGTRVTFGSGVNGGLADDANLTYDAATGIATIGTDGALPYQLHIDNQNLAPAIHVSATGTDDGGYITTTTDNEIFTSAGAAYDLALSGWVAKSTAASAFGLSAGALLVFTNTGLTPGANFTPTQRLAINPTGTTVQWTNLTAITQTSSNTPVTATAPTVFSSAITAPSTASAANLANSGSLYNWTPGTLTLTGTTTTSRVGGARFNAPTITDSSAVTVTKAATLIVTGAPTAAGSATIGTSLALDIESGAQAWHNAIGANAERVRAFWSSNVWNLTSEAIGTGTVRAIKIDSGTAATTLSGASHTVSSLGTGIVKSTSGLLGNAAAGTDYESPLTFSTGLTRATNTITANLSTGVSGGQSVVGGTAASESLTYSSTTNGTKGKHIFGSTSGLYYDESQPASGVWLGLGNSNTTAGSGDWTIAMNRSRNGGNYFVATNPSTGGSAAAGFVVGESATGYGGDYIFFALQGTNYTTVGPVTAKSSLYEHVTTAATAPMLFSAYGPQDIDFYTTTSRFRRLSIKNNGDIDVPSLGSGIVKSTSGLLANATTSDIASALSMPAGGRVLAGNTTAFAASDEIRLDTGVDFLDISNDGALAWYNLTGSSMVGATNYDRARSYWSSNIFHIAMEHGGTGVAREMDISAAGSTLALSADIVRSDSSVANVTLDSGGVTATTNPTFVSSAGLNYNGVTVSTPITLTGGVSVTNANGLNGTKFAAATYTSPTATSISHAATVAIEGPPVIGGSVTIANPYALWIQSGVMRVDSTLQPGNGGGPAAALGNMGGSGPLTSAQAKWLPINSGGATYWIPVWQ